ncbi:MAG: serpin family protein [Halobacteriaceae archaeon]
MDRRRFLEACSLAGLGATAGCAGVVAPRTDGASGSPPTFEGAPDRGPLPQVEAPTEGFVTGNTGFGFALQARLADQAPMENRFLSPYSIGVALAMVYAGARGQTREEMAETLRYHPTDEGLHRSIAALRADLPFGDPDRTPTPTPTTNENPQHGESKKMPFQLLAANAAWFQTGFPIREAYRRTLTEYYGITAGRVDFEDHHERARRQINAWVADQTRQEIPELFPPDSLAARTRLVLANAVYFQASWADRFTADATEPASFTALDGSTQEVSMMHEHMTVPYGRVDGHEIIELPYAGPGVDMVVVLPEAGRFREVERSLTPRRFAALLDATEQREGDVVLPRFQHRSSLSLPEYLQAMGMQRAFSGRAEFSGISPAGEDLAIGDVQHEATITVDEEGTEAAAATGVEVVLVSAPANPFEFRADRPFIYAIRHRSTGAILFLGRLVDAAAAQT